METLKIKKVRENAIIPTRATSGSAGLDLTACIDKPVILQPNELISIPTGLAIQIPSNDYAAFVFARSGISIKYGITLSNGVGVIDSDYRGEICVGLCNISNKPYEILPFERIAQLIIMPVCCMPVIETDILEETQRGTGGFGSTGRK